MAQFQERRFTSQAKGWVILMVLSATLIGWGLATYALVPEGPRQFDFGQLPDAPGESEYTTASGQRHPPPPQIVPLPEAATQPGSDQRRREMLDPNRGLQTNQEPKSTRIEP